MSSPHVTFFQDSYNISPRGFAGLIQAVLEKKVPFRCTVHGRSMVPFICDGDVITIAPLHLRLRPGDVVAFVTPSGLQLTIHRILHCSQSGYFIKGDNNAAPDGIVPISSIIGRVVQVEHQGRKAKFGLGVERLIIAWLSHLGLLKPVMLRVWGVIKPFSVKRIVGNN